MKCNHPTELQHGLYSFYQYRQWNEEQRYLYTNCDYPVAAYVAVDNAEAIYTMLLTPPKGLEDCPGMRVYGGQRKLPDDANFADRLDEVVAKLKSGVFVSMERTEFERYRYFMRNLSNGMDHSDSTRSLSVLRQKLVDDAGFAALHSNLLTERAHHQSLKRDRAGFFHNFHRLIEWLQKNGYKYPAQSANNEHEAKLGRFVYNVRRANKGRGTFKLDARRRAHLDAINFAWVGEKFRGTRSKFPANWADQIDEIFEF